jgi:hypothetical protein
MKFVVSVGTIGATTAIPAKSVAGQHQGEAEQCSHRQSANAKLNCWPKTMHVSFQAKEGHGRRTEKSTTRHEAICRVAKFEAAKPTLQMSSSFGHCHDIHRSLMRTHYIDEEQREQAP